MKAVSGQKMGHQQWRNVFWGISKTGMGRFVLIVSIVLIIRFA
jgi:hypothetical protein